MPDDATTLKKKVLTIQWHIVIEIINNDNLLIIALQSWCSYIYIAHDEHHDVCGILINKNDITTKQMTIISYSMVYDAFIYSIFFSN